MLIRFWSLHTKQKKFAFFTLNFYQHFWVLNGMYICKSYNSMLSSFVQHPGFFPIKPLSQKLHRGISCIKDTCDATLELGSNCVYY